MRDPDTVELENIAADLPTSALADAIAGSKSSARDACCGVSLTTLKGTPSLTSCQSASSLLPRQMTIDGDRILQKTKPTALPEGLTVTGDFDVTDAAICTLSPALKVGGSVIGLEVKSSP